MKRTDRIIEAIDVGLQEAGDFNYDQTVGGCVTCGTKTDGDDWCASCHPVTGRPRQPAVEVGFESFLDAMIDFAIQRAGVP